MVVAQCSPWGPCRGKGPVRVVNVAHGRAARDARPTWATARSAPLAPLAAGAPPVGAEDAAEGAADAGPTSASVGCEAGPTTGRRRRRSERSAAPRRLPKLSAGGNGRTSVCINETSSEASTPSSCEGTKAAAHARNQALGMVPTGPRLITGKGGTNISKQGQPSDTQVGSKQRQLSDASDEHHCTYCEEARS